MDLEKLSPLDYLDLLNSPESTLVVMVPLQWRKHQCIYYVASEIMMVSVYSRCFNC